MDDLIAFCVEQIAFDGDQGESIPSAARLSIRNLENELMMIQAPSWNICGDS